MNKAYSEVFQLKMEVMPLYIRYIQECNRCIAFGIKKQPPDPNLSFSMMMVGLLEYKFEIEDGKQIEVYKPTNELMILLDLIYFDKNREDN